MAKLNGLFLEPASRLRAPRHATLPGLNGGRCGHRSVPVRRHAGVWGVSDPRLAGAKDHVGAVDAARPRHRAGHAARDADVACLRRAGDPLPRMTTGRMLVLLVLSLVAGGHAHAAEATGRKGIIRDDAANTALTTSTKGDGGVARRAALSPPAECALSGGTMYAPITICREREWFLSADHTGTVAEGGNSFVLAIGAGGAEGGDNRRRKGREGEHLCSCTAALRTATLQPPYDMQRQVVCPLHYVGRARAHRLPPDPPRFRVGLFLLCDFDNDMKRGTWRATAPG